MPELSLAELAEATGGSLLRGNPEARAASYVINTRVLRPGGVFFALKGKRTDGHKFLREAAKKNAAAAVVEHEPRPDEAAPPGLIEVDDAAEALTRCGIWIRRRLSKAKWVAVTGSNGKTSTKELIAEGLSTGRRVHRTQGNFNNHLGVPLSLLACAEDAEFIVVELAMSAAGEIAHLTRMTDPDVGVVTNVRAVHLEFFDSLDDIAAAKGELYAVLRDEAVSIVNLDDAQLRVQAARHAGPRVTYGRHPDADVRIEELSSAFVPGTAMAFRHEGKLRRLQLRMGSPHAAFNTLAALAAVVALGADLDAAAAKMEQLEPGPGRGKIYRLERDILLVDDSYNSSPAALASVLETLKLSQPAGRKVLVMGDMHELGNVEGALHREAGKRAAAAGVDVLIAVGALARQSAETARRGGVAQVHLHPDAHQAAREIADTLEPGDLVVVKGSRGVRLEKVVQALTTSLGGAA